MLATLKEVLEKAEQGNYAVGAFNCTSLESGMAIVETAEELNSPVILQYADSHAIYFEDIAKAGITAMKADVKRAMKIFESDGKI